MKDSVFAELFGEVNKDGLEFLKDLLTSRGGSMASPKPMQKSSPKYDYKFYDIGVANSVIDLYIEGMPTWDISTYLGVTVADVDLILDSTVPFF